MADDDKEAKKEELRLRSMYDNDFDAFKELAKTESGKLLQDFENEMGRNFFGKFAGPKKSNLQKSLETPRKTSAPKVKKTEIPRNPDLDALIPIDINNPTRL